MFKSLGLAALAGVAAAADGWSYNILPLFQLKNQDTGFVYYEASLTSKADVGATTLYNANAENGKDGHNSESYSLNINAWAGLTFYHKAFEAYTATYDAIFKAIDITPYGQTVVWSRPDNKEGFKG